MSWDDYLRWVNYVGVVLNVGMLVFGTRTYLDARRLAQELREELDILRNLADWVRVEDCRRNTPTP